MRTLKIITISACVLLLANTKVFSQIEPSIYTGGGTFTHLGGFCGIGAEIKSNPVAFSVAAGPGIVTKEALLYDVGVKLYTKRNFFGGINYSFVRGELSIFENNKNTYYGFVVSLGYRFKICERFYGTGYLGAASDYLTFMPEENKKYAIMPRGGFMIGYELRRK